jgi:conjugal transfer pilus assembly protein TraK
VPASVVKKPTPVQPIESRQDVVVASGTNTLIPISRGQINRLVTPFDNPHIQTVSEAEISTSGNVIYVTTQDEKPVTMFVTPEDDESVAISLTLLPQGVPPIQANLILAKNVQGLASGMPVTSSTNYSGQARKWERSQPYMDTLRSLMREMALGNLPRGYSFGALTSGNKIPACAQPSLSFDFSKSQLIEGHDFRVFVATAENVSARTVEFDHGSCTHPHRAAVSAWPDEVLEPGQKTEVFVVTRVPTEVPQSSTRPSLLQ